MELQHNPLRLRAVECRRLHRFWAWFVVLGVVVRVLGGMALGAAFIVTFTTVFAFGIRLLAG